MLSHPVITSTNLTHLTPSSLASKAEKLQRKLVAASVNNTTIAVKNCKRESGQCREGGMFALELRVTNSLSLSPQPRVWAGVSVYHQWPPPSSISLCLDVILSPRLHTSASPNSPSSILVLVWPLHHQDLTWWWRLEVMRAVGNKKPVWWCEGRQAGVDDRFLILIWLGSSVTSIMIGADVSCMCPPTLTPAIRWLPHITASVTCQHSLHILNWKLGLQLQLDTIHCTTWVSGDSVNLGQNLFPFVCQVVIVSGRCDLTGWWCQCPGVLWCLQMSLVWLWGHFTASQPPPLTLVTANGWYFGWTLG